MRVLCTPVTAEDLSALSCPARPWPSRATCPLRELSTTRDAPESANRMAERNPRPPSPPVIEYEPPACKARPRGLPPPLAATRRRRGTTLLSMAELHATSISPPAEPAEGQDPASELTAPAAASPRSMSTQRASTIGCSRRTTRMKPQMLEEATSAAASDAPGTTLWLPHVSTRSRALLAAPFRSPKAASATSKQSRRGVTHGEAASISSAIVDQADEVGGSRRCWLMSASCAS